VTGEHENRVARVCAAWGRGPAVVGNPLATIGFSGSPVHVVRLANAAGRFVLKPFAPHVTRERAEWVHGLMRHARAAGVTEVPEVLTAADGRSVVEDVEGRLWELVQFVDGQPCASPTPARAAAALDLVARLHDALRSLPRATPDCGRSAGVERRIRQARDLLVRPLSRHCSARLDATGEPSGAADFSARVRAACRAADHLLAAPLGRRGLAAVAAARIGDLQRQVVVRDIWSDHVLFDPVAADRVAGLVDFHAAGIDTPLTDIARLLGSWKWHALGSDQVTCEVTARWQDSLVAYEHARGEPLTAAERWLCDWLHASAVICGLDNWFRWTLEENRHFPDAHRALERIDALLAELPPAVEWLGSAGNQPV
jgi:Ser/Thr protein kinase RdoA (MazF antagonist)